MKYLAVVHTIEFDNNQEEGLTPSGYGDLVVPRIRVRSGDYSHYDEQMATIPRAFQTIWSSVIDNFTSTSPWRNSTSTNRGASPSVLFTNLWRIRIGTRHP